MVFEEAFMPAVLLEPLVNASLDVDRGLFFFLVWILNDSVGGRIQVHHARNSGANVVCNVEPGRESDFSHILVWWMSEERPKPM
jgi:hypothetical protein